jgi:hypothetical protein
MPVVVGFGASRLPFATRVRHKSFDVQTKGIPDGMRQQENEMKQIKILGIAPVLAVLAATVASGLIAAPSASATCRTVWRSAEAQWRLRDVGAGTCTPGGLDVEIWQYTEAEVGGGGTVRGAYECMKVVAGETGYWNSNACNVRGSGATAKYVWGFARAKGPWEQCAEGKEKEAPTKFTSSQCKEAAKNNEGHWQWDEATENEKIKGVGLTLSLADTKALGGASKIRCTKGLEETGKVSPGAEGVIETAEVSSPSTNCTRVEGACKAGEVEKVKGVHLPWHTFWTETENKAVIIIESDGKGEPGWEVACNATLGKETDTCETESTEKSEEATLENTSSGGVSATYAKKYKETCSEGGAESGEEEGTFTLLDKAGSGLRVA